MRISESMVVFRSDCRSMLWPNHRHQDWSKLPSELVEEIILKIDWPEDVVSFSCVCHAWSTTFKRVRPKWTPANPWLLLSEKTKDNPECVRKAYNPGNNRFYNLKLPETFGKNCWGSDLGWIVTYGLDLEIKLLNPLTKSQISLPSTDTMMPEQLEDAHCDNQCKYRSYWMRESHILKARVFEVGKGDSSELVVAVIHARKRVCWRIRNDIQSTYLSIARPGDTRWTLIETTQEIYIEDVLFWRNLLWFVDNKRNIWYVDYLNNDGGQSLKAMEIIVKSDILLFIRRTFRQENPIIYLVESSDNRLLLVRRAFNTEEIRKRKITIKRNGIIIQEEQHCPVYDPQNTNRESWLAHTRRFTIFQLNLTAKKWEIVDDRHEDLGKPIVFGTNKSVVIAPLRWESEDMSAKKSWLGRSCMFLGKNTSMIVAHPKLGTSKCMSNSIYFAGDQHVKSEHDMGICDEDGNHLKFQAFHDDNNNNHTNSGFCNPFWFAPRFY